MTARSVLPLVLACLLAAAPARTTAQPDTSAESSRSRLAQAFGDRLQSLSPANAEAYLLLGEEIADAAKTPADRRLAVEVLARGYALARREPNGSRVAVSACLALADLTRSRVERGRLQRAAVLLDPTVVAPWAAPDATTRPGTPEAPEYQAAVYMGLVRAGAGAQARSLAKRPEVNAKLQSIDRLLLRLGVGGADSLQREAKRWPCPECGNARVSRRPGEARLCANCKGVPGPNLSDTALVAQLRAETWLLGGDQGTWSAQLSLDDGAPLPVPDENAVFDLFGIDDARPYWRNGFWRMNADGTDAPEPAERSEPAPEAGAERPPAGGPPS
ncbi:MAG TPA: hypothetical protein VD971_00395 [Phycisphaerales bacterium]|nr:hypothetical protein [Phycisphaerales bacterium]